MTIAELKTLFVAIGTEIETPVYHYTGAKNDSYIVWAEYGGNGLRGDQAFAEYALKVQLDYYHKSEADNAKADTILARLLEHDEIAVTVPEVDYESDTGYIHHIIQLEAIMS